MSKDAVPFLPRQQDEDIVVFDDDFSKSELKKIIRALNLKVTTQRLAILKALHEGHRHVTAQELFEKVNRAYPEIGFATVYRFLKTLNEGHFVTEVRMGGLPARYELKSKNHHDHLTCVQCGKICEFENKTIESLQEKVAKQFGYKLTHHVLELYGLCPKCQK
ncbi:MAG: Fur family transcriptional regulator [Pseudobdellovibrionaceae bacterium]